MKRKTFFNFAVGRIIAGLLIGTVIFGITISILRNDYDTSINDGFLKFGERFEELVERYEDGTIDETFIDIYTNLYYADYLKIAKVNDDGSFETIAEKNCDVLPLRLDIHNWIYVTDNEELLAIGSKTVTLNDHDWTIEYKKCDELLNLDYDFKEPMVNSWSMTSMSDAYSYSNGIYMNVSELSGMMNFATPVITSYYIDGDTFHAGKMAEMNGLEMEVPGGRKWDFTDSSKEDSYITLTDGIATGIFVLKPYADTGEFLNENADIFSIQNTSELEKIIWEEDNRFVTNTDDRQSYDNVMTKDGIYTQGSLTIFKYNGQTYMIEYVMSSVTYDEYFRPVLIIFAIFILILGIGIPCILAIRPYLQYKKAYENNIFKNNLIDSLAHNIKTPLQIIGGCAENLKDVSGIDDKDRYADRILAKTTEMNSDIEQILATADKSDRKFSKTSIRVCIEEAAQKAGATVNITGDASIKMDKDYFKTALFCLIDNAARYKSEGSDIEAIISPKCITIRNKTAAGKFTPGFGITIAGRIIEQHGLKLATTLKDGTFEARISKK